MILEFIMNTPKKHHIVPQMLLKNFANDKKICVYDKCRKEYYLNEDIKNVAVQNHFYTVNQNHDFETLLANHIEAPAESAFENFKENPDTLTSEDRVKITLFLTFMLLRTNQARNFCAEYNKTYLEEELINTINDDKGLREELREEINKNGFSKFIIEIPCEKLILQNFNPIVIRKVLDIIFKMNWTLVEAPQEHFFILGDTPVIKIVPPNSKMGLNNHDLILAMPLSPKLLLMADWKNSNSKGVMKSEHVERFNFYSIAWATKNIFYPKHYDSEVRAFVAKYGDSFIRHNYVSLVSSSKTNILRPKKC